MFDIKQVEEEARKEIAKEQSETAKKKIKAKLAEIANAEKVVANLRLQYKALLEDIALDV